MDVGEKYQIAVNALAAQRNAAQDVAVNQAIQLGEAGARIADLETELAAANKRIADMKPLQEAPAKTKQKSN